jgi:hypothetical protein
MNSTGPTGSNGTLLSGSAMINLDGKYIPRY